MEFQEIVENKLAANRAEEMKTSLQLTLGELILKLEPIAAKQDEIKKKYEHEAEVLFDFEYLFPTGLSSWRGVYAELALTFSLGGYGKPDKIEPMKINKFLKMLKGAIGKSFTGWKGGEFMMGKNTPLWVANEGSVGTTGIVDVIDGEFEVILQTWSFKS